MYYINEKIVLGIRPELYIYQLNADDVIINGNDIAYSVWKKNFVQYSQ